MPDQTHRPQSPTQTPAQTPAQTPGQRPATPTVDPAASYDQQRAQVRPGQATQNAQAQPFDAGKPRKAVSGKAMNRLRKAKDAITHAKSVFSFGAGNQLEAIEATNFNSSYRLMAMRNMRYWDIDPTVRALASANPTALTAAMAEIAHGGNCGEHATVGFDYLRTHAPGERITKASVKGLDHAFVLVGDIDAESDADLVVCDPWPTAATACTWEDHFANGYKGTGKADIQRHDEAVADGKNIKDVIKRGIKLNASGLALVQTALSEEETQTKVKEGTTGEHPWIWRHADSVKYQRHDYHTNEPQRGGGGRRRPQRNPTPAPAAP